MHKKCISLVPIFNHLEPEEMNEIVKTTRTMKYARNQEILGEGNNTARLYIVHQGRVKMYRLSESGKEQLIRILKPGDFMGELSLFSDTITDYYAVAMENSELCTMQRSDLQAFLMKYPVISFKIIAEFSRRLDHTEKQLSSLTSEDTEKRIAAYFVQLADANTSNHIVLPMTRKDLASYLGTTPETMSRKLAEFEQSGLIKQMAQRKIIILDIEALKSV
jgi:CRP-like cAMP-binding protein